MRKHTKEKRRESFRTNALCAYGWSMDPMIDYRESRPDWTPPTGPSVTLDLDAPMEKCPHCGDSYIAGPFAYGAHATIGCRVRRATPSPATLPYMGGVLSERTKAGRRRRFRRHVLRGVSCGGVLPCGFFDTCASAMLSMGRYE